MLNNKYNPEKHDRKSIRLKGYDYSSSGGYFVTICVKNRECLFGEIIDGEMKLSEIGEVIKKEWEKTEKIRPNVILDEYVIMPNHLHGIIFICDDDLEKGRMQYAPTNPVNEIKSEFVTNNLNYPIIDSNIEYIQYNHANIDDDFESITIIDKTNNFMCRGVSHTPINSNNNDIKLKSPKNNLGSIIRGFKSSTTKQINQLMQGRIAYAQLWQRNYHEWIIKNEQHLDKFRNYIIQNPLKWDIDSENPNKTL